jgi:ATP-dependent RNA helicase DOB1
MAAIKRSRAEDGTEVTTLANYHHPDETKPEPPITFPYPLDPFQQRSIDALEAGDSVLVSAHTSAGKTTVALYAIAKALKEKKRVIYTSPIKALSNQKFREFSEKWDSVGLMTGDTTIKPDSDCLVMTTEILRSMLYRGTEMLREVGCVVFDEVHYMRDKHRGVVWEETIVMLPEGCQYVFLSATIPNAREFADWVEHIHPTTKCHVVHTDFRPTPLQHFLYPKGADGIFLVIDEDGKFREDNYRKALAVIGGDQQGGSGAGGGGEGEKTGRQQNKGGKNQRSKTQPIMNIVKLAMDKGMYPIIVFSFAKLECERNAMALAALDFNTDEESMLVEEVFTNAIESLGEDDRKLPAIEHLMPLLKRGVGVHHSGLLPILKEVVELLFQAGLVKCLFSTETFSMGLNMPARTVIFTSLSKWDGEKQRLLSGGEYIQMSGRAGRRGLDRFGIVIAMIEDKVEPDALRTLMSGGADVLNSSFHLTYNMVLNLLRVEDVDPEFMMTRSFFQFQRERNRPQLEARADELQKQIADVRVEHTEIFDEYTACMEQLEQLQSQERQIRCAPKCLKKFVTEGRLVRIVRASDNADFSYGICVTSAGLVSRDAPEDDPSSWSVDVAVICMKADPRAASAPPMPCHVTAYNTEIADLLVVPFSFNDIMVATRFRLNLPRTLHTEESKAQIVKSLSKMHKMHGETVPGMSAEEMGIEDPNFLKVSEKLDRLRKRIGANELSNNPSAELVADYARYAQRVELEKNLREVQDQLMNIRQTVLKAELVAMKRVLRRLDFTDMQDMILRKGRVACEITTDDENELLLTELLFKGVLNDMSTEMIVALMSALVNVHRTPDGFSLPEEFQAPLNALKEIVSRIATVSVESGLLTHAGEAGTGKAADLSDRVMPSLMQVTYHWAKGARFVDVVPMTSAYEGDIVRMMRRLEELLRQMAGAARSPAIGSIELHDRFLAGIQMIKRDIVFASSLYL